MDTLIMLDMLLAELCVLDDLIAGEGNEALREELKQEQTALVAKVNNLLGTDHIAPGSVITTINNDLKQL